MLLHRILESGSVVTTEHQKNFIILQLNDYVENLCDLIEPITIDATGDVPGVFINNAHVKDILDYIYKGDYEQALKFIYLDIENNVNSIYQKTVERLIKECEDLPIILINKIKEIHTTILQMAKSLDKSFLSDFFTITYQTYETKTTAEYDNYIENIIVNEIMVSKSLRRIFGFLSGRTFQTFYNENIHFTTSLPEILKTIITYYKSIFGSLVTSMNSKMKNTLTYCSLTKHTCVSFKNVQSLGNACLASTMPSSINTYMSSSALGNCIDLDFHKIDSEKIYCSKDFNNLKLQHEANQYTEDFDSLSKLTDNNRYVLECKQISLLETICYIIGEDFLDLYAYINDDNSPEIKYDRPLTPQAAPQSPNISPTTKQAINPLSKTTTTLSNTTATTSKTTANDKIQIFFFMIIFSITTALIFQYLLSLYT